MIIFLYGKNTYGRIKKLNEYLSASEKKYGRAPVERFDFALDGAWDAFQVWVSSRSMFDPRKFAILENIFECKEKKVLKPILEANIKDKETVLYIVSDDEPPKTFAFLTSSDTTFHEFPEIKKGAELTNFIRKEAAARELKLGVDDITSLEESFHGDLWGIATELDKLALMNKVETETTETRDYFKLSGVLKYGKDPKQKLVALEIMLSDSKDDPARIFNGLIFGLNDKQKIDQLADYDVAVKSGKLDYEEALVDFALR